VFTGTFVVKFSITVKSSIPTSTSIVRTVDASVIDQNSTPLQIANQIFESANLRSEPQLEYRELYRYPSLFLASLRKQRHCRAQLHHRSARNHCGKCGSPQFARYSDHPNTQERHDNQRERQRNVLTPLFPLVLMDAASRRVVGLTLQPYGFCSTGRRDRR
jgi:hypothetical protein